MKITKAWRGYELCALPAAGVLLGAALLGAPLSGCGGSSSATTSTGGAGGAGSSTGGASSSTGGAGGTSDASSTSGLGSTSDASSSSASSSSASGTGGAGGGDPCAAPMVPGSLASGFHFNEWNDFQVGDTDIYVTSTYKDSCPARVLRFPKGGGPTELIQSYGGIANISAGGIGKDNFYWIASFHLWSVPLAGGAPVQGVAPGNANSLHLVLNTTDAFMGQSDLAAGHINVWRVPLAGGAPTLFDSFLGTISYGLAADDTALYTVSNKDGLSRASLAGGAPMQMTSGGSLGEALAVDDTNLYFIQNNSINSIPKAGGAVTPIVSLGYPGGEIYSMAVDATKIYWASNGLGTVKRADKTGGAAEVVASGQAKPLRVRLDATSVYWSTQGNGAIWSLPK